METAELFIRAKSSVDAETGTHEKTLHHIVDSIYKMSRQITQPVNQVRLTNVAVVKMNAHGKRFEIACYRNKLLNFRQGIETDLSEVLQTDRVFTNVSKGQFASSKDLQIAFGTGDQLQVCKLLLEKGEIQVTDMERANVLENTSREVASMVAEKCVDAATNRPFTIFQIREAMKKAEFVVQPASARSVKQQFLDCVKALQQRKVLNIQRANMELAIIINDDSDAILDSFLDSLRNEFHTANMFTTHKSLQTRIQFQIQPHEYKMIERFIRSFGEKKTANSTDIHLEIVQQVVLPDSSTSDLHSLPIGQHAQLYPSMAHYSAESHVDKTSKNLPQLSLLSLQSTAACDTKKTKKEKRREKEPDPEYQTFVTNQRLIREARQTQQSNEELPNNLSGTEIGENMKSCNTCGGSFNAAQYRSHFKSDWHRYNVKLKLKGSAPIDEKEFSLVDSDAFFYSQVE